MSLRLIRHVAEALGMSEADLLRDERAAKEQEFMEAYRLLSKEQESDWPSPRPRR